MQLFREGRDLLLGAARLVIWGINGLMIFGFVMVYWLEKKRGMM